MPPSNFPLRWESTGDKWWYASPIDWAAANGHYDLVRQLLRLDGNHLINLTSLRRIRRLEAVWDDQEQYDDVAKCRCQVAHQLFTECQNSEENSLIVSGYGGWLLYTAASAGDMGFVQVILQKYPLLVFGEGEYGLTDILYAAARSKNHEVFRVVYDFAVSPRFVSKNRGEFEEHIEAGHFGFKVEIKNRGVHAAARGGNLIGLKQLLGGGCNVLEFRDVHGSTILHSAAGRGQVEVVKHLIATYDMITSVDDKGNTPLHVAAYKSQLSVLEALIQASPSSALVLNKVGETFLHMVVDGFQTPGFRRLDQQIELMKQLVSNKCFHLEDIINSKNNQGRTALHLAIIGNVHSNLVELLMTAHCINLNIRDNHGMTPLDYLKRQPRSSSSEILIRQLISAGGVSSCKDIAVRRAFASQLKLQGVLGSPGTSFRISDNELFLCTGMDHLMGPSRAHVITGHFRSISSTSQCDSTNGTHFPPDVKKAAGPLQNAAKRFKTIFQWSSKKTKETGRSRKPSQEDFSDKRFSASEETPVTLRERYSNASLSNNKRTLAVRSNISSPSNRKKFAPGLAQDVLNDQLLAGLPAQSPWSSFSSLPSPKSQDKGKGQTHMEHETGVLPCSKQINANNTPCVVEKRESKAKRFMNPALCFGGSRLGKHNTKHPMVSPVA
ncbi:uncharacterized protein LOC141605882 [Silene latifolia]|uniref:uncharacterized protein LOC141605882 n=1 Tax=Silene latifolia TaxID=37657 RepID=UPI003D7719DB